MSTVKDYLRWYRESGANSESMDTAELAVEYAKYCVSEESRELHAIRKEEITQQQAEIARLNARVAELEAGVVCEFNRDDIVETCDGLFYVLGAHHGDGRLFVCSINGAVNEGAELEIQFCDVTDHWPESTAKNKMDWQNWKAGAA